MQNDKTVNNSIYNSYSVLLTLFYTFLYVNDVVLYKIVHVGRFHMSASSLIFPGTYLIIDIVTELYGYELAKRLIWQSTIFNVIFSVSIYALLMLPSPTDWKLSVAFNEVFKDIAVISITHAIIAPLSYFINAFLLSKWKIITHGKYFWFRSINSSLVGELLFSIIMGIFIWRGHTKAFIIEVTLATYMSKFIWAIVGSLPASLIVSKIRKKEHTDVYDYSADFNPFHIKE